jgi:Flp pilus assembly pilin Flp
MAVCSKCGRALVTDARGKLVCAVCDAQKGQGLVEYTLIVLLVALGFWVAVKETNIGNQLASGWSKVSVCVSDPVNCSAGS